MPELERLGAFLETLPRTPLGFFPTPAHRMPRLASRLNAEDGCAVDLWIKRDDQSGLAVGGNKVRKLEYLMADAISKGHQTVVTGGGFQSNSVRQSAAAAAKLGLKCVLGLHEGYLRTEEFSSSGNVILDELLGAEIRVYPGLSSVECIELAAAELTNEGRDPYVIPMGGSNALGSMGYALAALEIGQTLSEDELPQAIVVPAGSNGTAAGLAAGLAAIGSPIQVVAMCVDDMAAVTEAGIRRLISEQWELGLPRGELRLRVADHALGQGYGIPTDDMRAALRLAARTEGILLDPVYSGKAFAGMLTELRSAEGLGTLQRVLFWHTGGIPGIFPYRNELTEH
ncbi:MAG: D-cysteine desulfhydrase family protein [Propionibacteriaceae bacterium]|jgi:D-cysteine desulfhydrase/L-cysteate sulfo-lyase|nr:D-cysteine desulfhydrase family protein [Propionibacteriaceae bacterium]